ncbi:MAG: PQQ-dependent dehydrogenase, methanol/ethanol family [Deltaproteobacteria bacterium]|nr:PQQ-dependent dehydrogenase, methanol/ethanol family [Deltaproteobacteria bacterium]MBW2399807.1 PQQ-dependent dehydrogenase, methanol/ethanol family [Deltaproteobacteria bacterium]
MRRQYDSVGNRVASWTAAIALAAGFAVPAAAGEPGRGIASVDGARISAADSEPHNWLAHGRTWSEQRFSPLDGVTRENVNQLGLAWAYETGTTRGLEATPLVIDGVMYATGTWSHVFALDAATGRELWHHDPKVPGATGRRACCDIVNRGVAVWKGRVYLGTLDGRLVALDAETGKPDWEVLTVDPDQDYTITGAPRVAKGLVFIGNGGGEFGVRGYFSAYDAATGELRWRFYTVPGDPSKPFEHPELEIAASTWSKDSFFEAGLGGTVWDSMAYDPELDLLYVGVGNSSVYNREIRSPGGGDNLFLASILAVKPDTGKLIWHYQTTPAEYWDYTATQHMILADLEIAGETRQVIMQAPKNGFFYLLDRKTGELLSAEKFVFSNWASHVDLETGRPVETGRASWADERAFVVPGPPGAHNWHPMSYSPRTGLVYIPTLDNAWAYYPKADFEYVKGAFNTGEDFSALGELLHWYVPYCTPAHLTAWNPVVQKQVWRVEHDHPINGGVLSTAGGLVFQGNGSGEFSAYDDRDGERLWRSKIGVGVMAPPVTYAIDGEQYVAVLAGIGGTPALNHIPLERANAGRILAYKLGGAAAMPEPPELVPGKVHAPIIEASAEVLAHGKERYVTLCARCHGFEAKGTGFLPDLRHSPRAVHDAWDAIVLKGAFANKGMAGFADLLDADDAHAIHAYVAEQAHHEPSWIDLTVGWARKNLCVPVSWVAD